MRGLEGLEALEAHEALDIPLSTDRTTEAWGRPLGSLHEVDAWNRTGP